MYIYVIFGEGWGSVCNNKKMANKLFFLLLCLLGLFISTYLGEAAQCATDKKSLCTAHCNGTSFELSKAFDFP